MSDGHGAVHSRDGTPIYYERWKPQGDGAKDTLVIIPGRGEHTGRYRATAEAFASSGFAVWVLDLRGQGHSGGPRGHINSLRDFLQDMHAVVALASAESAGQRPVLLGHSMGGLIALHYAVEYAQELSGVVVSSPLCGLAMPVARWEEWLAYRLSRWWPTFTFHRTKSDAHVLSHDPRVQAAFLADPLVHFRVSARLYYELTHASGRIDALVQALTLPTLVLQAGDDRIVSVEATRRMFANVGGADKQLILYEGWYHELFNEVDAARVIRDVVVWLQRRSSGKFTLR